jgi:CRP-like cAMP-binding protein
MALVGEQARSADVVAESPTEVLRLDSPALERLRTRFPFTAAKLFRNMAGILSERLRNATAALMRTTGPSAPAGHGRSPTEPV